MKPSLVPLLFLCALTLVSSCDRYERYQQLKAREAAVKAFTEIQGIAARGDTTEAAERLHRLVETNKATPADVNTAYARYMMAEGRGEEAFPYLKQFAAEGRNTYVTDSLLGHIFLTTGMGNETTLAALFDSLRSEVEVYLLDEVRKKMTDSQLADFVLMDTQGNAVALSSFRGKVVVLDFWATWCGPCIVSFPDMQRIMAMVDPADVHFLYVNTMEHGGDATAKARDFMAKNGYDFHTLIDEGSLVTMSYRIRSIPTQIIVGPDGRAKFRKTGYSSNFDRSSRELRAMIALAKDESAKTLAAR